ncbi:hypothetical protein [Candidatus Frankia nodulisporulans]|uniref:hypothetical protein n=1 Tax=Candidatus Frankia nodulisporulans TaxID=2060052 RepID=UPI0013D6C582|nr:hypothetical protein [Candidatus Frankia nodulisporulans]
MSPLRTATRPTACRRMAAVRAYLDITAGEFAEILEGITAEPVRAADIEGWERDVPPPAGIRRAVEADRRLAAPSVPPARATRSLSARGASLRIGAAR